MRIATVCFSETLGGLELATLRAAAELQRHGHDVIVVLPPNAEGLHRQAITMGLRVESIGSSIPYLDLPAARKLHVVLAREKTEIILVGRTRDLSTAMLAAGKSVAIVLFQQMQSGINKRDWFHNKIFRRLDGCIAITEAIREQMIANTVLDPERISVVYYGIDSDRFNANAVDHSVARSTFGIPEDAFVVGIVGGFNPGKGQADLLEALPIAIERDRSLATKLYALFVGERDGDISDYTASLRQRRAELPNADRIIFHPFLDDPRIAYRALDIFVLASHSETFGMVLQEALAMEVPSIATDAGGVPEIVTHNVNGLLVPPHDPSAIADAIIRLYQDRGLAQRLATEGRRLVLERYDFGGQVGAFEDALIDFARRHTP